MRKPPQRFTGRQVRGQDMDTVARGVVVEQNLGPGETIRTPSGTMIHTPLNDRIIPIATGGVIIRANKTLLEAAMFAGAIGFAVDTGRFYIMRENGGTLVCITNLEEN